MQKTKYPFEIIVHDDASTDGTASIVRQYEAKFPDLFANIYQSENQFSKSILSVTKITFGAARGKYLALCEGDDYWTDPLKIEKQIDFLEANPEYTACAHAVYELSEHGKEINQATTEPRTYTIEDLAEHGNFLPTTSSVFRNTFEPIPDWFSLAPIGDFLVHMVNASRGKIYYMPEPMAVYRKFTGYHGPQTLTKRYLQLYKTLDVLIGRFNDEKIDRLLRRQQAKCIVYWYNNDAGEIVSEQAPLVNEVLEMVMIKTTLHMARFKLPFLVASVIKKISLLLRHNPVVNKLDSLKTKGK